MQHRPGEGAAQAAGEEGGDGTAAEKHSMIRRAQHVDACTCKPL